MSKQLSVWTACLLVFAFSAQLECHADPLHQWKGGYYKGDCTPAEVAHAYDRALDFFRYEFSWKGMKIVPHQPGDLGIPLDVHSCFYDKNNRVRLWITYSLDDDHLKIADVLEYHLWFRRPNFRLIAVHQDLSGSEEGDPDSYRFISKQAIQDLTTPNDRPKHPQFYCAARVMACDALGNGEHIEELE